MIKLEDCSTKIITINLKGFILAKLLNIENLVHFRSDSSIMLSHQNGVAAYFKKYNSFITNNYCIVYHLHLADQVAAEKVSYFEKYKKLVKGIYTYFNSPYKRLLILKMVQNTLKEPELIILNISIKEALLDEAANNMQAAILLADIYQTFEILPISDNNLANYGNEAINILSNFYETEKVINN
ncbi:16791_t:CDS:2, partial [Cetraspora pellucida]